MTTEEQALEAFIIDNQELEELEARLGEFNIFEAIGAVRQELRHSDFLAFLLNPTENHGLGDEFLKRFLKAVVVQADDQPLSVIDLDVIDLTEATIQREWRHIDILIHDEANDLICVIENKVDSTEHSEQLQRYRGIVEQTFQGAKQVFIYLTPEGDSPSDESYIPFDYEKIADLVELVSRTRSSTLGADVNTLMDHYTALLRRHIVNDSDIAKLCQKIYRRHQKALDLIFEHRPDLQSELAERIKTLGTEEYGFLLSKDAKRYITFYDNSLCNEFEKILKSKGWSLTNRLIYLEFENAPDQMILGVYLNPNPTPIREVIYQKAQQNSKLFKRVSRKLVRYPSIHKKQILRAKDYESNDLDSLFDKVKEEWQKFLEKDFEEIRRVLYEIEWPEPPTQTEEPA